MKELMDNPFSNDHETDENLDQLIEEMDNEEQPKDLTKHIRGDATKEPWNVKRTLTETEKKERHRALIEGKTVAGYKKRRSNQTYKRARLSDKDFQILVFLSKFDWATTKTISTLLGVKDAGRRVRGLREWRYLKNPENTMNILVWTLTGKAIEELNRRELIDFEPKKFGKEISLVQFNHTIAISHTAALMLSTNPYSKIIGSNISLSQLVGERQLLKSMAHYGTNFDGKSTAEQNLVFARKIKSELQNEHISLYSPYPDMTVLHRPDFLILNSDGSAVAVEVELTRKNNKELDNIIEGYKRNTFKRIKGVLYVCRSEQIFDQIKRSKKRTKTSNQVVPVPLADRNHQRHDRPIYEL